MLLCRLRAKEVVIEHLIAGRITFPEAIASFIRINQQYPGVSTPPSQLQGATEEERYGRQVLSWVRGRVADKPLGQRKQLLERLQREWAQARLSPEGWPLPVQVP